MPNNFVDEFYVIDEKGDIKCVYWTYKKFKKEHEMHPLFVFENYPDALAAAK